MDVILEQFGLNSSFFIEFGLILVIFLALSQFYFKPFLALFEQRHQRTVADKAAAETLMVQVQAKLEEYKRLIASEKLQARKEVEKLILDAKKQEAEILAAAREDAKKLTQEAAEAVSKQHEKLKRELEQEVDVLAGAVTEKLLSKKA